MLLLMLMRVFFWAAEMGRVRVPGPGADGKAKESNLSFGPSTFGTLERKGSYLHSGIVRFHARGSLKRVDSKRREREETTSRGICRHSCTSVDVVGQRSIGRNVCSAVSLFLSSFSSHSSFSTFFVIFSSFSPPPPPISPLSLPRATRLPRARLRRCKSAVTPRRVLSRCTTVAGPSRPSCF